MRKGNTNFVLTMYSVSYRVSHKKPPDYLNILSRVFFIVFLPFIHEKIRNSVFLDNLEKRASFLGNPVITKKGSRKDQLRKHGYFYGCKNIFKFSVRIRFFSSAARSSMKVLMQNFRLILSLETFKAYCLGNNRCICLCRNRNPCEKFKRSTGWSGKIVFFFSKFTSTHPSPASAL